jgi:hypothetical protein
MLQRAAEILPETIKEKRKRDYIANLFQAGSLELYV